MLTYNHGIDGGTFEESTPLQRYQKLLDLREQCLFQLEVFGSLRLYKIEARYWELYKYITNKMKNFYI